MSTAPALLRLADEFSRLETLLDHPARSPEELQASLAAAYRLMFATDFRNFDVAEVRREAPALMRRIFLLKMRLRDAIEAWHERGLMTLPCQTAARDVFRVIRFAIDILGEIAAGHPEIEPGAGSRVAFTGGPLDTMMHPAFARAGGVEILDGDIIVMRGMAHNSAAIARIGDVDSQFSHVAMVHIDAEGRRWIVEALIEEGALVHPLEEVLAKDLGRAILLRHKDNALARRAAKFAYDRVRRSRRFLGTRILYDFTMRPDRRYRRLFCSKLIRMAYDRASRGAVVVPTFTTRLVMRNRDFLDRIGVRTIETFAPGDLEIDPRFDLVAEWRDFRVTRDLRIKDLVMVKLFQWMETHDYRFKETLKIRLISWFGRLAGLMVEDLKNRIASVIPKVPPNMRARTIATIAMLHETAEPLFRALKALDQDSIARSGRPLHPREVFDWLEAYRAGSNGVIGYLKGRA